MNAAVADVAHGDTMRCKTNNCERKREKQEREARVLLQGNQNNVCDMRVQLSMSFGVRRSNYVSLRLKMTTEFIIYFHDKRSAYACE